MANYEAARMVTGEVRFGYVQLLEPKADDNGVLKYSTQVLIPKSDTATKQRLDAAINAAIENGIERTWSGKRPPKLNLPVHDGDGVKPVSGEEYGPECKGHWVLNAKANENFKPQIVDAQMNPIISPVDVYSGMYGRVQLSFYAYSGGGNKGVGVGLGPVQKLRDGEPLAGRPPAAEDVFEAVEPTASDFGF